jgi:FAD/FMN-containing dehydrogenase
VAKGSRLADRILSFDPGSGLLRAEAGVTLLELNRLFLRRGWFVPVSPGTQFVTLGGMVAADVHGKNHHRDGCFGAWVTGLRVRVADGRILDISPRVEPELFFATVGGMGLLGHILEVEFRMVRIPSPWILCESERIGNLEAFLQALEEAGPLWPYTVGWIDCLSRGSGMGRGILQRGRFAEPEDAPALLPGNLKRRRIPFELPGFLLCRATVRLFNELYYRKHFPRMKRSILHPEKFFYPLDALLEWNLLYGPRGFTQYQCVLPREKGGAAARRFLELLTSRGGASFLCVIKDCGQVGGGLLSFPLPGISVALDIPVRDSTQELVDALNELVIEEGGRIYLAKDAFTRSDHFRMMEPRLARFLSVRRKWDPEGRIRSAQSIRLLGDKP